MIDWFTSQHALNVCIYCLSAADTASLYLSLRPKTGLRPN